jgi:electron transfer flavoprotein alpha subunit
MKDIVICLFAAAGFDKSAQGLAGAAQRLAGESGGSVHAILLGREAKALAPKVTPFVQTVLLADKEELDDYQPEACLDILVQACRQLAPSTILLSSDTYSQEIAPRLAHRLGGSAVGDGIGLNMKDGALRVTRLVYGGKAQAVIEMKRYPAVIWLRTRTFAPATVCAALGEIKAMAITLNGDVRSRIVERKCEDTGELRLEDARVIVSGGRGVGGAEPFNNELRPLAELLGAQLAATRAACDAGWVPASWQVGQTGKHVAPDLYLAIGLSGASQHLAGISDAKNIAAINIDPEAGIFKYCQFGIVGDYRKVVPLLRQRLEAFHK